MKRLNKKGFTLVELLAVIVILALIMAIAIYSISGILQNSREGVFKDTGLNIIRGVKNQLLALNAQEEGTYYFSKALLENDNVLPFGGKISLGNNGGTALSSSSGDAVVYKKTGTAMETTCTKNSVSFVNVYYDADGAYKYVICLVPTTRDGATTSASSTRLLSGLETDLMGNTKQSIFAYGDTISLSSNGATKNENPAG